MKFTMILLISLLINTLAAYSPSFMRQPTLSPDGNMVCFNYMTDLWIVPFEGGEAKRITVSDGEDSRPLFSPDGKWISFHSDRDGFRGVYIMPAEGGFAELVSEEAYIWISDWYADSKKLLGTRFDRDTGTGQYTVYLDGRRAKEITPISHFFSYLSPDQNKIIFNQRGNAYRPAYTGSLAGNLWEYDINTKEYTQLTFTETTERYPVYSHVNPYIYYGGSDGNRFQLYRAENYDFENSKQLTFFEKQSVRNISIARENDRIVFERFDKLWRYDPETENVEEIDIVIRQDFLGDFTVQETYTNAMNNAAVSPDGKLIAFSYKYDLFAMPEKGGEVKRITYDQKEIGDVVILPDNRTIYFTKREQGSFLLYSVDINTPDDIVLNYWSLGKYIRHIYMISERYLAIHYKMHEDSWRVAMLDIKTKEIINLIQDKAVWSWFLALAPRMDYAFYVTGDPRYGSRDLHLYDINKAESVRLFSTLDYVGGLYLGHDLQTLFLTIGSRLVRLDLTPKADVVKSEDNWDDILEREEEEEYVEIVYPDDGTDEEDKPVFRIKIDDIESRMTTISNQPGTNMAVHIISDSTLYYVNRSGNRYTLRRVNYRGENDEEIVSISGSILGWTTAFKYNHNNKHFYAVVDNKLLKINPASKRYETIQNKFDYEYCDIELNRSVFDEVWTEFGNNFYDPDMHNRDWNEMYERFKPFVDKTYRVDYLSYIVSEMIGELDASHTGFSPARQRHDSRYELAFIGCTLDFSEQKDKGIRFKSVYRGSTLHQKYGIKPGDVLLSVDGKDITPTTTISKLFEDKVGKPITLKVRQHINPRIIEVKGLTAMQEYELFYEDLIIRRRELVTELSNNRLGYLHIPRMQPERIDIFLEDIFARNRDKEGIIIDVRGNSGGRISRYLLDILTRTARAYTTSRGYPDQMFETPNHVWDRPVNLLIDQGSSSDAEIFPILFRQKELGTVIGMPTGGGVIGTVPYTLMDGSTLRMPRAGWFTKDGVNMEGTGAQPDILIDLSPEDRINNNDVQLKKAIQELLNRIDETVNSEQ